MKRPLCIPWKSLATAVLILAVAGCDNPQSEQANPKSSPLPKGAEQSEVRPRETMPVKLPEQREAFKKDLRIMGDGRLPAPKVEGDSVARIAPSISAEDRNAREKARIPKKPDIFALPVAQSSAVLISGDTRITLEGIEALEADAECKSAAGNWPCGNFARAALQRLIRTRSLTCDGERPKAGHFQGNCRVGNQDLASWVVEQGWAKTRDSKLQAAMTAARDGQKGMWRK